MAADTATPLIRRGRLDVATDEVARLSTLLSPEERARAARFRFDADRRRFVVRRGLRRLWLAEVTGEAAGRIAFVASEHGKPALPGGPFFSQSHSGEETLLAIDDWPVGCDIERIDARLDWRPLAERFFAPSEVSALIAMEAADARTAFFRCWARKEAFVKAIGQGLAYPLDAFQVSLYEEPALLCGADGWRALPVDAADGYAAALVVQAG